MFSGLTGVYEVCASLTGAVASVGTPFITRYIPYDVSTGICVLSTALAYLVPTLPSPLAGASTPQQIAAPIIGTMFGGFVYAFGTNIYLAAAAFFPPEAVLALSAGSGCAIILGPSLYTGIMAGLHDDWRRTFLVFLSTTILIPIVWWGLTDPACRAAAERCRVESLARLRHDIHDGSASDVSQSNHQLDPVPSEKAFPTPSQQEMALNSESVSFQSSKPGFGQQRSRVGFLIKTIIPKYTLPLIFCTSSSIVTLLGTTPTLQTLGSFRDAPDGNLQFQLACELPS
jgi:hypothetical protein